MSDINALQEVEMKEDIKKSATAPEEKKDLKAMIISEFPVDSVIGTSEQANDARKGIIEYVKHEKPDVIFVDGLVSYIRFPEIYGTGILESEPLETFMEEPFKLASAFLKELKSAAASSKIYYALSDADEDNIRRLTKYISKDRKKTCAELVKKYLEKINECEKQIDELEKANKTEEANSVKKSKAAYMRHLNKVRKKVERMPNSESVAFNTLKEEISQQYIKKFESMNKGVEVRPRLIETEVNGFRFLYSHNFNILSPKPLESSTTRFIRYVNRMHVGNVEIPEFILEGGHNAETVAQVYRHDMKDKYSLMFSSMVMEDQRLVKNIIDGKYKPELFQGLQNRLPACKRQAKKAVAPAVGISIVGKKKDGGFFVMLYSMEHLSRIGRNELKIDDMKFETLNIFSDLHIGKGAVRYDKLKNAVQGMLEEVKKREEENLSSPILFLSNESLQGRNYPTMVVETRRKTSKELAEFLTKAKEEGKSIDDIIEMAVRENQRNNEPRLDNQMIEYHDFINYLVLETLLNSKYDIAVVMNEGTHIKHTIGEYGLPETFFQEIPFRILDDFYKKLVDKGLVQKRDEIANAYKKIMSSGENLSGHIIFNLKIGENNYKISSTHKTGSSTPEMNIPVALHKRAANMKECADINISAHLHMPYFSAIGRLESNGLSAFYKGATFNEHDEYGKRKGWPPPVIGYVKGTVPTNQNGKGVYGVEFITSEVL